MGKRFFAAALLVAASATRAGAVTPDEMLRDPMLETRARAQPGLALCRLPEPEHRRFQRSAGA